MVWKVGPGFKEGNIKHTRSLTHSSQGSIWTPAVKMDCRSVRAKSCAPQECPVTSGTPSTIARRKPRLSKECQCLPERRPHCRMVQQLGHQRSPSFQTSYEATAWETNSIKLRIGKLFATNVISWITRWITYILQHMRGIIENRCKCSQTQVFLWHKSEYIDFFFLFRLCFAARPKLLKC